MSSNILYPIVYPRPPTVLPSANFSSMSSNITHGYMNIFDYVNMNDGRITNLSDPLHANDATNKQYVDSIVGGGNLTGPITAIGGISTITSQSGSGTTFLMDANPVITIGNLGMDFGRIVNLATPINSNDAATKNYVDTHSMADLVGPITSVGNITSVNSQTGIGSTFVMNNSPILITPNIGSAISTSLESSYISLSGDMLITGKIISTNSANASTLLTGSIYTPGGISVSKDIKIGGTCSADKFLSTSDKRLKNQIEPIDKDITGRFLKVKGYQYYMRNDPNKQYGILAQELEELGLGMLVDNSESYKRVSYQSVIPLLIETIRETNEKINELSNTIESLNCKLNMVEKVTINNFKRSETDRLKKRRSNKS